MVSILVHHRGEGMTEFMTAKGCGRKQKVRSEAGNRKQRARTVMWGERHTVITLKGRGQAITLKSWFLVV